MRYSPAASIFQSARERASHYLDRADQLRDLAETEPDESLRDQLFELAEQEEQLAKEFDR